MTMLIDEALITHLLAQTAITALVGRKIYPVIAPQNVVAPYIVVFKVDGPRDHSHDGASHLANPRFQLSVFSTTYSEAKAIAAALQAALEGYTGTMGGAGGVAVNGVFYENETDLYEPDTKLYHIAVDYKMWHQE